MSDLEITSPTLISAITSEYNSLISHFNLFVGLFFYATEFQAGGKSSLGGYLVQDRCRDPAVS